MRRLASEKTAERIAQAVAKALGRPKDGVTVELLEESECGLLVQVLVLPDDSS